MWDPGLWVSGSFACTALTCALGLLSVLVYWAYSIWRAHVQAAAIAFAAGPVIPSRHAHSWILNNIQHQCGGIPTQDAPPIRTEQSGAESEAAEDRSLSDSKASPAVSRPAVAVDSAVAPDTSAGASAIRTQHSHADSEAAEDRSPSDNKAFASDPWWTGLALVGLSGLVPRSSGAEVSAGLPTAWRSMLMTAFCDQATRHSIHSTGRAGRDWALQDALHASVTVPLSGGWPVAERRLQAAARGFATRGHRNTELILSQPEPDSHVLHTALRSLQQTGRTLTCLRLPHLRHYNVDQQSQLFSSLSMLSGLRALHVDQLNGRLPEHSSLHNLTELHCQLPPATALPVALTVPAPAYISVSRYLPQLQKLVLPGDAPLAWPRLFPAGITTSSLTEFEFGGDLSDQLLTLLLDSAPALSHLSVQGVSLQSNSNASMQWALKVLKTAGSQIRGVQLAAVPASTAGLISFTTTARKGVALLLVAGSITGVAEPVMQRLSSRFQFKEDIVVAMLTGVPAGIEAAALRAALQQLVTHKLQQPPGSSWDLYVYANTWAPQVAQMLSVAVTAKLAARDVVAVCNQMLPCTDEFITTTLQHATGVTRVMMSSLARISDHYRSICPWKRIDIRNCELDLEELAKLPCKLADQVSVTIKRCTVRLCLTSHDQLSLMRRVTKLTFQLAGMLVRFRDRSPPSLTVRCPPDTARAQQPGVLSTHLRIVKAVQVIGNWGVKLDGWSLAAEVVRELGDLPEWCNSVDLSDCVWPQADWGPLELGRTGQRVYNKLASTMPPTCAKWAVPHAQARAVLSGLHEREKEQPREGQLTLCVGEAGRVEAVRAYVVSLGLSDKVKVQV